MIGQDYYRLARADSAETIPCYFEEGITLHEMENLKYIGSSCLKMEIREHTAYEKTVRDDPPYVTSHGEQMIAMLNYFYANSQLSHKERIILRDFIHKKLENCLDAGGHPIVTIGTPCSHWGALLSRALNEARTTRMLPLKCVRKVDVAKNFTLAYAVFRYGAESSNVGTALKILSHDCRSFWAPSRDSCSRAALALSQVWPHPFCTLLYSETIEEDKDNGVVLRVKRFIELNITTWSIRLLKTAECLRKVPRFTWAKFYAK